MIKTTILPAALAAALLAPLAAQAASTTPAPMPEATRSIPALSPAARAQLAEEGGISPKKAERLDLSQLAWLKYKRDGDDGAYAGVVAPMPHTWPHV
jgi:hypothetical protein